MNPQAQQIQDLTDKVAKLQSDLDSLSGSFYKNNFSSHQDFNKDSTFSTKLKIPVYTTLPSCEIGDIVSDANGKMYISTATNTFTVVGTQS
jgi:hypothetical protein